MANGIRNCTQPGACARRCCIIDDSSGKIKCTIFFIGMVAGYSWVGTVVILLPGVVASHGGLSDTTGIVKIILGILLLILIFPI